MGTIYRSKVDWWIGLILGVAISVLVGTSVLFIFGVAMNGPIGPVIGILCLVLATWIGWLPSSTIYEIEDTELIIHSSGWCWRIRLRAIVEVLPTKSLLSSPACSLDRLRVNYLDGNGHKKFVLISPQEKEEFLRDLAMAVPRLKLEGDRCIRRIEFVHER